jgi:hypothetical protein
MKSKLVFCFTAVLFFGLKANAQTDAELLFRPWRGDRVAEGRADGFFFPDSDWDSGDGQTDVAEERIEGRWRLSKMEPLAPTVGYTFKGLTLNDSTHRLPDQFVDTAVAGAAPFAHWGENGGLAALIGVGYAGDDPFGNGRGWYGKAALFAATKLDEKSSLLFILDYDGNRNTYPDVPIPGVAYSFEWEYHLSFVVGFPYSSLSWTPNEHVEIRGKFLVPDELAGTAIYHFNKKFAVYASYEDEIEAFDMSGLPDNTRIFYFERRAEAGIRISPSSWSSIIVAGGYAFNRKFETGFDVRDADRFDKLSQEPYLRVGFEVAY